ncbi:MAG: DUF1911 domain-containing protein [Reinekea sp.]
MNINKVDSYVAMLSGFKSKALNKISQGVDDSDMKRLTFHIYNNQIILLIFNYSKGVSIDELSNDFSVILEDLKAYLKYCDNLAPDETLEQYIDCLRILSFCYFFGSPRKDIELISSYIPFAGKDMLVDRLLASSIPGYPISINKLVFPEVYSSLVKALSFDQTQKQRDKEVHLFLENYYSSLKDYDVTWHDSHKELDPIYFRYIGYWIFELAALSADIGWDDSAFRDHEMYPKDLVDWKFAQRPKDKQIKI